jgi:hypothetical protein
MGNVALSTDNVKGKTMSNEKNFLQQTIDKIQGTWIKKGEACEIEGARLHQLYSGKRRPMIDEYRQIALAAETDLTELITRYESETNPNPKKREKWAESARFFVLVCTVFGALSAITPRVEAESLHENYRKNLTRYTSYNFFASFAQLFTQIKKLFRWLFVSAGYKSKLI